MRGQMGHEARRSMWACRVSRLHLRSRERLLNIHRPGIMTPFAQLERVSNQLKSSSASAAPAEPASSAGASSRLPEDVGDIMLQYPGAQAEENRWGGEGGGALGVRHCASCASFPVP